MQTINFINISCADGGNVCHAPGYIHLEDHKEAFIKSNL